MVLVIRGYETSQEIKKKDWDLTSKMNPIFSLKKDNFLMMLMYCKQDYQKEQ